MTTLAEELALLSEGQRKQFINGLTEQELYTFMYDWSVWARPEQLTPSGNWNVWLILAGRGYGKTRTSTEDVKKYGLEHPSSRIAIVAPTYADARDTCVEGESGLLRIIPKDKVVAWNRSLGELILTNGSRYKLFSSDEPERLRGPQHHRALCDEVCAWKYPEATWDMLMFGLRLGQHPQVVAATTPKPIKLLKELVQRKDVYVTRGSTFDNATNLAPAALEQLRERYGHSRLGRQELFAEILEDVEGALWNRDMIERSRIRLEDVPTMRRIVISVDPAVTSGETSDMTGIAVLGVGTDGLGYVLHSEGMRASPDTWAKRVSYLYHYYQADRVIAEVNQGGDLVVSVMHTIDRTLPVKVVRATRGKMVRAEPVAALWEQQRVRMVA